MYWDRERERGGYLAGRCSWILAMRPMDGSARVYMVARIAITTKSQEDGLAGYTPVITLFCTHREMRERMNKREAHGVASLI